MPLICPQGKIIKVAYKTKKGIKVGAACVSDKGRPGKGKPVWKVQRGGLKPYRVVNRSTQAILTPQSRHRRLKEAYKHIQPKLNYTKKGLMLARLNALRNYYTNATTPRGKELYRAMSADMKWVDKNFK